jgi:hypothetical protein
MLRLYLYARVRFFAQFCTRDRGCSKHPAFPAPSIMGERIFNDSGALRREGADSHLHTVIASQRVARMRAR